MGDVVYGLSAKAREAYESGGTAAIGKLMEGQTCSKHGKPYLPNWVTFPVSICACGELSDFGGWTRDASE